MDEGRDSHETGGYADGKLPNLTHIMAIRTKVAENYAPFSEEAILHIRETFLQPRIDLLVKNLDTGEVSSKLAEMQKSLEPIRSPRQLTALFIIQKILRDMDWQLEKINVSVQTRQIDNAQAAGGFAIMCDFDRGILEVAESVLAAEDYLAHGDHTLAKKISAIGETVGLPTEEQANLYIGLGSYIKTYARILQQDPSGFTLVERAAQDVGTEENSVIEKYRVPVVKEFMVDGANAGVLIYKALYPKAQKILQE